MRRTWSLFLILFLVFSFADLYAQEEPLPQESQETFPQENQELFSEENPELFPQESQEFFPEENPESFSQENQGSFPEQSQELPPEEIQEPFPWMSQEPVSEGSEEDEESPEAPIESEWIDYSMSVYSRGDKTFVITLGVLFPTYFSGIKDNNHGLSIGGTGSLAFNYFLTSNFFVGGEVGGMFASTRGDNMLYIVPFGVRAGYQFIFRRFEFPISVMIGGAPQKKLDEGYFGLIVKPGASAFWRFNPDWSFGLNAFWWFVPQWPRAQDGKKHFVNGNFLELTLSARYHF